MLSSDTDLRRATERLVAAGCLAAAEEAEAFVAAAPDPAALDGWLRRREAGEPPAWILGTMTFGGRPLKVAPGVFVPRPQTEELARRAVARLPAGGRALDLCTGAGAIAAHLRAEVPGAIMVGTDINHRAATCARANGVPAVVADLDAGLRPGRRFDVVTAVAPYVPTGGLAFLPADVRRYEPRTALDGGPDGLVLVRRVVAAAGRVLRPGGWLLTEIGGDQLAALAVDLEAAGFGGAEPWWDDDGDLRGVAAPALSTP